MNELAFLIPVVIVSGILGVFTFAIKRSLKRSAGSQLSLPKVPKINIKTRLAR
jgi:hypothetical protein